MIKKTSNFTKKHEKTIDFSCFYLNKIYLEYMKKTPFFKNDV